MRRCIRANFLPWGRGCRGREVPFRRLAAASEGGSLGLMGAGIGPAEQRRGARHGLRSPGTSASCFGVWELSRNDWSVIGKPMQSRGSE
jgi:hypothetical protein